MPRRPGFGTPRRPRGCGTRSGGRGRFRFLSHAASRRGGRRGASGPRLRRGRASSRPASGGARGACRQSRGAQHPARPAAGGGPAAAAAAPRGRVGSRGIPGSLGGGGAYSRAGGRDASLGCGGARRARGDVDGSSSTTGVRFRCGKNRVPPPGESAGAAPRDAPRSLVVASRDARTSTSAASIAAIRTPRARSCAEGARETPRREQRTRPNAARNGFQDVSTRQSGDYE